MVRSGRYTEHRKTAFAKHVTAMMFRLPRAGEKVDATRREKGGREGGGEGAVLQARPAAGGLAGGVCFDPRSSAGCSRGGAPVQLGRAV